FTSLLRKNRERNCRCHTRDQNPDVLHMRIPPRRDRSQRRKIFRELQISVLLRRQDRRERRPCRFPFSILLHKNEHRSVRRFHHLPPVILPGAGSAVGG